MLPHLLPGALFWSIIFHHCAGSAIMNNEKREGEKKKQNIEKEAVLELSQLPQHWWCFLWLTMESWRDEGVHSLQHCRKHDLVTATWIQREKKINRFRCTEMCKLCHLRICLAVFCLYARTRCGAHEAEHILSQCDWSWISCFIFSIPLDKNTIRGETVNMIKRLWPWHKISGWIQKNTAYCSRLLAFKSQITSMH